MGTAAAVDVRVSRESVALLLHPSLIDGVTPGSLSKMQTMGANSHGDVSKLLLEARSGNGTIPEALKCVLGCLVPAVFASLTAENLALAGLGCMLCKAKKLSADTCTEVLKGM